MNSKLTMRRSGLAALLAFASGSFPTGARAQGAQPAPAQAEAGGSLELGAGVEAAADAPPEAQPEPPPPPPPPPPADKPLVRFYGIVKPTVVYANGLESFGNATYVAPTAAVNPVLLANPDATALSFQAQQTRIGVAVGEGLPVKGVVEFDFVDFAKSSPAQSTTPRVRQAFVEWSPKEGHKLTLGQLWDVFSPLNSHTYNLVGGLFQSGNAGFMRHQAIYAFTVGNVEIAGALGLTTQNLTNALNAVEYGRWPTFTLRGSYRLEKKAWLGAAVIATRLRFDPNLPTEKQRTAAGGNLFADLTFGAINLRAEAYAGQNLNNLGMLVLGQGYRTEDVAEAGGWVSAKASLAEVHAAYVMVGAAAVLNTDDMQIGYTPAAGTTPAARAGGNGPGIERNVSLRAGYAYTAYKGLSLVFEPFLMLTQHKLAPAEEATLDADRKGYGVETGAMYTF